MTRQLKTWPEFFGAICDGSKPFEIRVGEFAVGDVLELMEFDPCLSCQATGEHPNGGEPCHKCSGEKGTYTGQVQRVEVTYVTDFCQRYGLRVLGIRLLP